MATLSNLSPQDLGLGGFGPTAANVNTKAARSVNNAIDLQNPFSSKLSQAVGGTIDLNNPFAAGPNNLAQQIGNILPNQHSFSSVDYLNSLSSAVDTSGSANYKVRLVSVLGLATAFNPGDITSVMFEVTPAFSENGSVDYAAVQPVHMPGSIQTYKYTQARTFTIGAKLISRNSADALRNMKYLQTLRSWRYPFFGNSGTNIRQSTPTGSSAAANRIRNGVSSGANGAELLGAPPELLYLYAYSTTANDARSNSAGNNVNINRVPVVLTSLGITYPDDCDYIPVDITTTNTTEPFPIKIDVSISLTEAHSPREFEKFDLMAYKTGNLVNF
jgi:hypothetical protein